MLPFGVLAAQRFLIPLDLVRTQKGQPNTKGEFIMLKALIGLVILGLIIIDIIAFIPTLMS